MSATPEPPRAGPRSSMGHRLDAAEEVGEARNSTVDRALRVMEAFIADEPEIGVLELSRQLDLDKSVIHRILTTLVRRRFLEQDPVSRRYRVGLRAWELGRRYLSEHQFEQLAERQLTSVVQTHPFATAYLSTLDGADVVVVTMVRGPGPINIYIDPGTRMPAELTATGQVLLACLPELQMTRRVNRRRQAGLGGRTPRSLAELTTELAHVREQGHSVSRGEYAPGIGTVAVAVRTSGGDPAGALSIDFLIAPETENLWEQLPIELGRCAAELERTVHGS